MELSLKQQAKELLSKKKFIIVNSNGLFLVCIRYNDFIFEKSKNAATRFETYDIAMKKVLRSNCKNLKIQPL